jgi:hypothetical protein
VKKKIYILPDEPSPTEFATLLESFEPPLSAQNKESLGRAFDRIRQAVRDASINEGRLVAQTQTISDGTHTVTLKGSLTAPSLLQKLLG